RVLSDAFHVSCAASKPSLNRRLACRVFGYLDGLVSLESLYFISILINFSI
ncbi:unnamed protein product, partial [Brassica oleracea var. botrytis]